MIIHGAFGEKTLLGIPAAQSEDLQSSIQTTQPGGSELQVLAVQYESIDMFQPRAYKALGGDVNMPI